jgi:Fusaric acid resistance protein-like
MPDQLTRTSRERQVSMRINGDSAEVGENAAALLEAWPLAVLSVGAVAVIGYRLVTRAPPDPLAATLTKIGGISDPQWVIWSAASVALGDPAGSWAKARVRGLAVLIGVPLGLLTGYLLPADRFTYSVLALLIALSLVAVPNYALSVTIRTILVAAAGLVGSHSVEIGLDRVRNLLIGGLIGGLATAAFNKWWSWREEH